MKEWSMNIEMRRTIRLALAPVACALLAAGCATYEHEPYPNASRPAAVVPPPLTTFDRLDANRDGFISRAENEPQGDRSRGVAAESATAAFHRLDANADGFLSRAEANVMLGIPGWSFDAADTNRDGFLNLTEAMPHLRWYEGRAVAAYPSFEALDVDRDGFLSRAEAQPLMDTARWVDGRWVVTAPPAPVMPPLSFDRLDADRDGFLTRAEAAPAISAPTFDRFDENRDGFLSRGEVDIMMRSNVGATYAPPPAVIYGPRY
jgi:Ca2+-binding EF-hand superfamily protein